MYTYKYLYIERLYGRAPRQRAVPTRPNRAEVFVRSFLPLFPSSVPPFLPSLNFPFLTFPNLPWHSFIPEPSFSFLASFLPPFHTELKILWIPSSVFYFLLLFSFPFLSSSFFYCLPSFIFFVSFFLFPSFVPSLVPSFLCPLPPFPSLISLISPCLQVHRDPRAWRQRPSSPTR